MVLVSKVLPTISYHLFELEPLLFLFFLLVFQLNMQTLCLITTHGVMSVYWPSAWPDGTLTACSGFCPNLLFCCYPLILSQPRSTLLYCCLHWPAVWPSPLPTACTAADLCSTGTNCNPAPCDILPLWPL